jgi:hypothetical protein
VLPAAPVEGVPVPQSTVTAVAGSAAGSVEASMTFTVKPSCVIDIAATGAMFGETAVTLCIGDIVTALVLSVTVTNAR